MVILVSAMVFYRKYRPQSLSELIGQEQVKQTLFKAHQAEKLAHAYLFCGPRGTGKTSTARILAKMINCEKSSALSPQSSEKSLSTEDRSLMSEDSIPCNKCATCLSITDGTNLDLIEIDAASNRGIDDIRDLKERIRLAPTQAKKKVYIIDEVHMLTTEAFNALLKTLEEPPAHVVFILATTEAQKLPQTILSRVQRLDFKTASNADLVQALERVVKAEKLEFEPDALKLIARQAEGSFRDSLKLLDQIASRGGPIDLKTVQICLKSSTLQDLLDLISALKNQESYRALGIVHTQFEHGISPKELTNQLLETLRSLLMIQSQAGVSVKEAYLITEFDQLSNLASSWTKAELIRIIHLIQASLEQLKFTSLPNLPLEVAIVEACLQSQIQPSFVSQTVIPVPPRAVTQAIVNLPEQIDSIKDDQSISFSAIPPEINQNVSANEIIILQDKWNYILETIKPDNYSLEALLRQAKLLGYDTGNVILEVPYAFHQRILETPRSRHLLESVLSDVLGKSTRITTKLGQRPLKVEELANIELAQDDEVVRIAAEIFNS